MADFQIFIILLTLSIILVGIAQKIGMPYPVALTLGGTALGFVPGLQAISFDPDLILIFTLPPILYYAAFGISFTDFKRNWKEIFSLALGLVILTTIVIGMIFKYLFPNLPWALAFAFGAIVSPPDSVATTAILKRFNLHPRLIAILEGESLINDASALLLYRLAVFAILSGSFSFSIAGFEFFKVVIGGIFVGLISGYFIQNISKRYLNPIVAVLFSFTIPYITYIFASYLDVSGILAVVINGLIGSRIVAKHHSSMRRILAFAAWDIFFILMNCVVFILIGLQLKRLVSAMSFDQILLYIGFAALFTAALIIVRLIWVYFKSIIAYLKALLNPKTRNLCPQIIREAAIIGWSGMRGIVSLAAALALPFASSDGTPVNGRDEVIFLTFIVILMTLLLPSLTLAYLINYMKLEYRGDRRALHQARKNLLQTAEEEIQHMHAIKKINEAELDFLKNYFTMQRYIHEISSSNLRKMSNLELARLRVFKAQRNELLAMWEEQTIDDQLFRQLEHELDVDETHIARAELN